MGPALILALLVYGPISPDVAPELRARITAIVRARGVFIVEHAVETALADRRDGWRPIAELGYFAAARTVLERARRARERVDLDEALITYGEAEASYAAHLDEPGVAAIAGDAALERGVTAFELGRSDEARAAFRRALELAPDLALTERHARPDVVRLFREISRAPRAPARALAPRPADRAVEASLLSLRDGPRADAAAALLDVLGLDATLVVVLSPDGQRAVAARLEPGCATQTQVLLLERLDESVSALLARPCDRPQLQLAVDDERLKPPAPIVAVAVVAAKAKPDRRRRTWPWVFVGALGVTAAVIGVTVGVVAADPKYSLRVDSRSFGAQ